MTEDENTPKLTDKQKKITAAAIIGTLILGSGVVALSNRDRGSQTDDQPKTSKVSRVRGSNPKKNEKYKSGKQDYADAADDVFSTYGLDLPGTNSSSDNQTVNSLSPSEIQTMANTLGSNRKTNTPAQVVPTMVSTPAPSISTNPVSKKGTDDEQKNGPIISEEPVTPPVVVVPDPPVVPPPVEQKTTPTIVLNQSEVVLQEGNTFDPKAYFSVSDTGDSNPNISFSSTSLVPGKNEIHIYVTNKFGNQATAKLTVFLNRAPVLVAKENVVDVSIHTIPDLKSVVTAEDPEDGDISGQVEIAGYPDMEVEGTYSIVYSVSDSQGGSATPVTIDVNVVNEAPVVHVADREVSISEDTIDLLEGLTVTDKEDDRDGFPISLSMENILEGAVDLTTEGEYVVKLGNVKDRDGKAAEDVEFTVKVTNLAPEVSVPVLELKVGDHFDSLAYKNSIVFSDIEDSKAGVTPTLEITQSDLDAVSTAQAGDFTVTIKVTDSSGKSTTITGLIKVVE